MSLLTIRAAPLLQGRMDGDRTVRREVRLILKKYGLPTTGDLFDHAYAYIRENY